MSKLKSGFTLVLTQDRADCLLNAIAFWLNSVRLEFSSDELASCEMKQIEILREIQAKLVDYLTAEKGGSANE